MLNALRLFILRDPDGFRALIAPLAGKFDFMFNCYKRISIPAQVPEDLRNWYALKSFYLQRQSDDMDLIASPALADWVIEAFHELTPLYHFLMALPPVDEMPAADIPAPDAE